MFITDDMIKHLTQVQLLGFCVSLCIFFFIVVCRSLVMPNYTLPVVVYKGREHFFTCESAQIS